MTSQRRIIIPVLAAVVAVVLIVVGIDAHWPGWLTAALVVLCCAGGVLAYLMSRPAPLPEVIVPPQPIVEPPPPVQVVAVQGVHLASSRADYEFLFDATIYWRLFGRPAATRHVRPGARAVDSIIERAAVVAAAERPDMALRLQHHLNDVLGVVHPDSSGRVEAWADQVRIVVPDADLDRLHRMAAIRKDEELWAHERRFECDRRQYLTEDVLRSTGTTLVWWLAKDDANVQGAAELIDTLARLSATARDEPVLPTLGSDGAGQPLGLDFGRFASARTPVELVTALVDALKLDENQVLRFVDQVAKNIEHTGNPRPAEQLRERFGLLTQDQAPADPGDGGWPGVHAWPEED